MTRLINPVFRGSLFSLAFAGLVFTGALALQALIYGLSIVLLFISLTVGHDLGLVVFTVFDFFYIQVFLFSLPLYMAGLVSYFRQPAESRIRNYMPPAAVFLITVLIEYLLLCLLKGAGVFITAFFAANSVKFALLALLAIRFLRTRLSLLRAGAALGSQWFFFLFAVIGLIWILLFIPINYAILLSEDAFF